MTIIDEEYQPVNEIEIDEPLVAEIGFKPLYASYICLIVGILLIITGFTIAMMLGAFFILISLFVHFALKDYKTMDIYETYLILYDTADVSLAKKVMFDDIVEWNCKNSEKTTDALMLKFGEFDVIYKDTFQANKVYKVLYKLIREKETYVIKEEENKKKKLVFRGFKGFDRFKKKKDNDN
ncbi:MAG: hypothetical protein R3Y57_00725 [Erysipelotrichaceae bacterium]